MDCYSLWDIGQAVLQKPKRTQRLASISIEKMLGILKEHQVHTRNGTTSIIGGATLKLPSGALHKTCRGKKALSCRDCWNLRGDGRTRVNLS